jgi:hypothetical protein
MRLLDLILGNSNRNSGNWLVRPGGFVVARIDHGNSNPLSLFGDGIFPLEFSKTSRLCDVFCFGVLRVSATLRNVLKGKSLDAVWSRIQRVKEEVLVQKPRISVIVHHGASILRLFRRS